MAKSANPFKNLEARYRGVKGKPKVLSGGAVAYELIEPCNDSYRVIVPNRKIYSSDTTSYVSEVFLERQTRAGNWIATTCPRKANPWLTNELPDVGETLNGRVSAFADDYAAILEVQYGQHAFDFTVPKDLLPSHAKSQSIRDTLYRGDLLAGRMMPANRADLRLTLDVKSWIDGMWRYWRTASQYSRSKDQLLSESHVSIHYENLRSFSESSEREVLIIEDSVALSTTLASSLSEIGCSVTVVNADSKPSLSEAAEKSLQQEPDTILLDFQLDVAASDQQKLHTLIISAKASNPDLDVLVFSGNLTTAPEFAAKHRFGYLSKPVSSYDICKWIVEPKVHQERKINRAERKQVSTFSVESKTVQVIQKTNKLLDKLCARHKLLGAAWFIELTPDRFELRAHSKSVEDLVTEVVVDNLSHSIVSNALVEKTSQHGWLSQNDPIFDLCPPQYRHSRLFYFAVPLLPNSLAPRVVVFLSQHPFSSKVRSRIEDREDHFELLMDNISQTEALDEISASASLGRVALGTIHDIRTELATVQAILNSSSSIFDDTEKVKLLEESLPRAYNMSKGTLAMFQASGSPKFRISTAILDICKPMRRYVRDEFPETVVEIFTDISEIGDIEIAVNPIPIERAIINLIDNAAHYCSKSPISKIWITGKRNFRADPRRPIELSISDTGKGLNVLSRARLFRPRSTERPAESTGIGLFLTKTLLSEIDATIECQERPLWAGASFIIRIPEKVS